jgi:serine/threonine protein kinase
MRTCPICNVRWPSSLDYCLRDGSPLPGSPKGAGDSSDPPDPVGAERGELSPYRIGDELRGHILEEELGVGAMGAVWRARHAHLHHKVAIKALHPDLCTDADALRRFFREAQVVNALKHPNIVRILDFVDEKGRPPYVVMEYLEGDLLDSLLSPDALLRLDACFAITRQIADAMATVHDQGMVHRDLKPDNVFVEREDGGVSTKLVDFGLAKFQLDNNSMLRTQTGAIVGTPMYMAPEQIRGQQVDHRCDIYAMGCTLYALLTGEPPFIDDKVGVVLKNHLYEPPVPPTARVRGARRAAIPPELERATLRCLAKEPELRLQSMRELVEVIDTMRPRGALVDSFPQLSAAPSSTPAPAPAHDHNGKPQPAPSDRNRQTQKIAPLSSQGEPSRWWYGTVALALILVGALIAVWAGRLGCSDKGRSERSAPREASGRPQATTATALRSGSSPATRMIRVVSLPPGASLVNPRTGQVLWRTPALVALPSGRPRQLAVELEGHKRRFITLKSTTLGPLRLTLQKVPARARRNENRIARPRPRPRPRPPMSSRPSNDQDTVNPFR